MDFDKIWNDKIRPLEGTTIKTLDKGLENKILQVTDEFLERDSKNDSKPQTVPKRIFKAIYEEIINKGELYRTEIDKKYPKRYSSIICAVLAKVDDTIGHQLNPIILFRK